MVLSLLTDVRDDVVCPRSPVHDALQAATKGYFAAHPHFRRGDHNERKVRNLIKTHLEDKQNSMELECLILAMEDELLFQQFSAKMREHRHIHREQPEQTSSEAPPQPSRKRSRSRSASPMAVPNKRPKAKLKARPKGMVRFQVPGPQSAASSSGSSDSPKGMVRFELPGPQPAATKSSDSPESVEAYPWESDKNEWIMRDCWVCPECTSINMRFTHRCACGGKRELMQVRRPGDRECPWCGNLIFA